MDFKNSFRHLFVCFYVSSYIYSFYLSVPFSLSVPSLFLFLYLSFFTVYSSFFPVFHLFLSLPFCLPFSLDLFACIINNYALLCSLESRVRERMSGLRFMFVSNIPFLLFLSFSVLFSLSLPCAIVGRFTSVVLEESWIHHSFFLPSLRFLFLSFVLSFFPSLCLCSHILITETTITE